MSMPIIVAIVFIVAMIYKWELTALVFGIILLMYACGGAAAENKPMYEWTTKL